MKPPRILVAGIGNIFLGDDAFGVEVVRRLAGRALPEGVRVVDYGIRGLDLSYALLDGYEVVIMVDAAPRGGRPGTLYVIEPARDEAADTAGACPIEAHGIDPVKALRLAATLGEPAGRLLLVGCEPSPPEAADDPLAGMSDPVRAAVDEAVILIESLVKRLLDGEEIEASFTNVISYEEA
jgi:hydrogenase maturation protease